MRYSIIFFLLLSFGLAAQKQAAYMPGQLLVQFKNSESAKQWQSEKSMPYQLEELVPEWHQYLLRFDPTSLSIEKLMAQLRNNPEVLAVQKNHLLTPRRQPNDPKYTQWQWNMELLGLPSAWEQTTGGVTALGDSIVVAVIDGGCDLQQEDLAANIWYNHAEIPNDSLDNDNNGYIDDYAGWQVAHEDDVHVADGHGTSVAGIIGAVGDNGVGMSGINWKVKLMIISASEQDLIQESNIIKAYRYVLTQRRLYRLSNGQQGAFVVAANLSAGVDYAQAADFPLWCAIYDSLGQEGILCSGAVMNADVNVDQEGDMPTTCGSNYLITVTNTTRYDALDDHAAYGRVCVDLGAPGEVYSTRVNNTYNVFGGTSGAAPHVAGAVALLSAYPNEDWALALKNNPASTALTLRQFIFANVDPISPLHLKSTTGGRLNIGKAMSMLNSAYAVPEKQMQVKFAANGSTALLSFDLPAEGDYVWELFDLAGRLRHRSVFAATQAGAYSLWFSWDWKTSREMLLLRLSKASGERLGILKVIW